MCVSHSQSSKCSNAERQKKQQGIQVERKRPQDYNPLSIYITHYLPGWWHCNKMHESYCTNDWFTNIYNFELLRLDEKQKTRIKRGNVTRDDSAVCVFIDFYERNHNNLLPVNNYLIDTHVAMIWSCNIYSWQGRIIIAKLSQQTTAAAVTTVRKMKNHIYTVTKQNGGRKNEHNDDYLY